MNAWLWSALLLLLLALLTSHFIAAGASAEAPEPEFPKAGTSEIHAGLDRAQVQVQVDELQLHELLARQYSDGYADGYRDAAGGLTPWPTRGMGRIHRPVPSS